MLRAKFTLCFVSLFPLAAICARAAEQKYVKSDEPKGRFHMDRPADWQEKTYEGREVAMTFVPQQSKFGDSFSIIVAQLPSEVSEDRQDKDFKDTLPHKMKDFHLISDEPIEVAGHHVHRMVYTATVRKLHLEFTLVCLIVGKTEYMITFTTLADGQKQLEPIIDHVLKSFKLEEKGK